MSRTLAGFLAALALACACVLALAARGFEAPGLYYDEVIQATPAAEFLREGGEPLRVPGASNVWLFGGWLPLMTQPYMSALKSQLLIPVFAVFGASPASLRLTTLLWGCAGLVLLAFWMRESFGADVALVAALLLALDPSFVFVCRHDWGSVALALALRGGGLWLLCAGWRLASPARLAAGGLLLGLGVTNKIDFAAFVAGAALALLVAAPPALRRALRARPRRALAALAGLALGSAPMWIGLVGVLGATRALLRSEGVRTGELAEKLGAWATLLDGSHFHRLMLTGGRFDALADAAGALASPFAWIFAASAAALLVRVVAGARRGEPLPAERFALVGSLAVAALLLATPRAARIHHVMNVLPLPQLVVALALRPLWRERRVALRALAACVLAVALAGALRVDLAVRADLRASGGRGRWSDALDGFARELPADARVVSLDWGFHAPLRFLRPELALEELPWRMQAAREWGDGMELVGDATTVYLIHERPYAVFDFGDALLEAAAQLPMGSAVVREHRDREGNVAFLSVRFARPHHLGYRGGFEVTLR